MFIFVYATLRLSYIVTTLHRTTYSVIHPGHNINGIFKWESQHEKVFNEPKHDIAERQVLRICECSDAVETVLTTDASCYGLGAVLTQISGGEEKIIAFASRTLSDAEKNYYVIEKEMLAFFWATKRLRSFLWGMNYTLRTDHKPLVNILTTKGSASDRTSHRINRWSSRMLGYNFNVEYLQGINNVVADCLSRLPLQAQPEEYSQMTNALRRYKPLLEVLFLRAS